MSQEAMTGSPVVAKRLSIRHARAPRTFCLTNRRDIECAADALAQGAFGLIHFGNIVGLFCEPSADTVGDMNEFKGSERIKPVSITAFMEPAVVSAISDSAAFPPQFCAERAIIVASALDAHGPVGFILPATPKIPDHLSVIGNIEGRETKTVQVITAGIKSPFYNFVQAVAARSGVSYFAATSANISSYSTGSQEPVHYRMKYALREFTRRENDRLFVLAVPEERQLGKLYPYHDARSTTIVKLHDISRSDEGMPLIDRDGRYVLQVTRWGSMDRDLTSKIINDHGYGVQFPVSRVAKRSYSWSICRSRSLRRFKGSHAGPGAALERQDLE